MPKPDLTEFFEETTRVCIAGRLIDKLAKEDKEKVLAALEESSITAMAITRFMQKRGQDAKHPALLKHRKKECVCNG
jgi:hypothetical protein